MDATRRPTDRRTPAPKGGSDRMHRMWLPLDRPVQACKSGRSSRSRGSRAPLLARLNTGLLGLFTHPSVLTPGGRRRAVGPIPHAETRRLGKPDSLKRAWTERQLVSEQEACARAPIRHSRSSLFDPEPMDMSLGRHNSPRPIVLFPLDCLAD